MFGFETFRGQCTEALRQALCALQTHILRYKNIYFSLLYVVCHKAVFILSETESFLTLHAFHL
jgi:hypothetical protein